MGMSIRVDWVEKAERLTPALHEQIVYPQRIVSIEKDEEAFQGWRVHSLEEAGALHEKSFGKGDSFTLDFGDHQVGYIALTVKATGSPPDAPLRLKLVFGETPAEIAEEFEQYDGWLSRSWLQDEIVNIDVLPNKSELPRRYTFRYLKVTVIDSSRKYQASFADIRLYNRFLRRDLSKVEPLPSSLPEDLRQMDRIAVRTLQNCMQTVFEDGPKRDRRLWIGDLRLQALANYVTFGHKELVKRCLDPFAGLPLVGGATGACVFEKPEPHVDDTYFFDYSLFFRRRLPDYYVATEDGDALRELWPLAWEQVELALLKVGDDGIVDDNAASASFIDWHSSLDKQAAAQGVLIYCLKRTRRLALVLGNKSTAAKLAEQIMQLSHSAVSRLYDEEKGLFVSGKERQISWASQVWLALAEVLDQEGNRRLLDRLFAVSPDIRPNTPYMHHHLVDALFAAGDHEKAIAHLRAYWGEMMKDGADTFWEVYSLEDKRLSPYGSHLVNSYCHAWSCTPTYFIRQYLI
uniref:Rhamnosidase C n=1 Tax=Paenibacillus sp. OTK TaxID=1230468 RepID=M5A8H4_9BACL|nr:rhamnosidase C [Paenibacillus sp. OTK]